jgi:hypothetical protein
MRGRPSVTDQEPSAGGSAELHPDIAKLRLGSILAGALRLYRRQPARVAVASLAVLLPLVLVSEVVHIVESSRSHDLAYVVAFLPSASELLALLGLVVLGGVMDELVGAEVRGEVPPGIGRALRSLPFGALVVADLVVTLLVTVGAALGAIPGLLIASLVGIVGPVVNVERQGPWAAVRRSIRLTWPHALLAIAVVVPSLLVEAVAHAVLLRVWDALGLIGELAIEIPLILTVGAFVVLSEVVLAYALMARDPGSPVERMVAAAIAAPRGESESNSTDGARNAVPRRDRRPGHP